MRPRLTIRSRSNTRLTTIETLPFHPRQDGRAKALRNSASTPSGIRTRLPGGRMATAAVSAYESGSAVLNLGLRSLCTGRLLGRLIHQEPEQQSRGPPSGKNPFSKNGPCSCASESVGHDASWQDDASGMLKRDTSRDTRQANSDYTLADYLS